MERIRRSGVLGSRDSREGSRGRREPYFMVIERGCPLGYRKTKVAPGSPAGIPAPVGAATPQGIRSRDAQRKGFFEAMS